MGSFKSTTVATFLQQKDRKQIYIDFNKAPRFSFKSFLLFFAREFGLHAALDIPDWPTKLESQAGHNKKLEGHFVDILDYIRQALQEVSSKEKYYLVFDGI